MTMDTGQMKQSALTVINNLRTETTFLHQVMNRQPVKQSNLYLRYKMGKKVALIRMNTVSQRSRILHGATLCRVMHDPSASSVHRRDISPIVRKQM